ncbi:hypothetical protein TWF696_001492 [Orbilia brochopaga]|uniref:Uncharacterized protein n=1 Tax=Orbilia brochopaga TaxID=3140254 RepID=A0AAV9UBL3_9PEZI
MSTAIIAVAALVVIYNTLDLALENCLPGQELLPSEQPGTRPMDTIPHEPSSSFVRMQRKISSINLAACFFGKGSSRSSRSSIQRREEAPSAKVSLEKDKPKYVHRPQYAADSHARTTNQIPFSLRPLSPDVTIKPVASPAPVQLGQRSLSPEITIEPVKTKAQLLGEEQAKKAAGERGRVHLVGVTSS